MFRNLKISKLDRDSLETALELATDALLAVEADGGLTILNSAGARLLAWEDRQQPNPTLSQFISAEDLPRALDLLNQASVRPKCSVSSTITVRVAGGARLAADMTVVAQDRGGIFLLRLRPTPKRPPNWLDPTLLDSFQSAPDSLADTNRPVGPSPFRPEMAPAIADLRGYVQNVLEKSSDIIMATDMESNIVAFNRGAERTLGYSRDEVLGRSVEMLYPDPEEWRALNRKMEHFDGAVPNYETRLKHKNSRLVDIMMTMSLLTDNRGQATGTVSISKDITEFKKAETALEQTRDYLNAILENTPDIIITTDLNKQIVSFNRGAERVLGYNRHEVLGRHIEDLYADPEERRVLERYLASQKLGAVNYETQLLAASGRVVDIDLTLSLLRDKDGLIIGTVGVSRDITEENRVEAELAEKKALLEEAQIKVMHADKMATLGKLATTVAHEINNPLGGILMFCGMIEEDLPVDHQARPDLEQIREQALRCKEIVKGLLEFGRMAETSQALLDLNRTVEQSLALFANPAIFPHIEVIRDLDPHLPPIMGDAGQLIQVFTNLISNAVDAMAGHGRLIVRTRSDQEKSELHVEFSDTGTGIPQSVMNRLFEPFFTTKPSGKGVGLGLSISNGIARRHGGRITARSQIDSGSTFIVHLPLDGPDEI